MDAGSKLQMLAQFVAVTVNGLLFSRVLSHLSLCRPGSGKAQPFPRPEAGRLLRLFFISIAYALGSSRCLSGWCRNIVTFVSFMSCESCPVWGSLLVFIQANPGLGQRPAWPIPRKPAPPPSPCSSSPPHTLSLEFHSAQDPPLFLFLNKSSPSMAFVIIIFYFNFFFFFASGSLVAQGWPWISCVVEADLELPILLPPAPECYVPQELLKQLKWLLLKRASASISPWDDGNCDRCVVLLP